MRTKLRLLPPLIGPAAALLLVALLVGAGPYLAAPLPAVAAPRLPPAPPGFEPVTVLGRWDGDAEHQPWLRADDGIVWRLCFRDRHAQDIALGPLDSTRHVRATGVAAAGGKCNYLYVSALVAVD